jgi:hypothetical protein
MNLFIVASVVITATVVAGILLALAARAFSTLVTSEQQTAQQERGNYKPALTMGHQIPFEADPMAQLKAARRLAAKQAAALPRWANMRIGQVGQDKQPTAFDGIQEDPITMVKIAMFHGWQGLQTGAKAATAEAVPGAATARTLAPIKSPDELEPGVDYEVIAITDDMSPADVRKARIANAKARAAAAKALKEAAEEPGVAPADQVAPVGKAEAAPPAAAPAAGQVREPEPGVDYEAIEITEDMTPDQVRKARIQNARARSAAMKRIKEEAAVVEPAAAVPATRAGEAEPTAQPEPVAVAHVPPPEYIEITDEMDAGQVRQARIQNAKARSAYLKALKEAGIDPASVGA